MNDHEQTDIPLKYNYGRLSIGASERWAEVFRASRSYDDVIAREMERSMTDMHWAFAVDAANAHFGPVHHPNRSDLYKARRRIMQDKYFRSLGHPAGRYRRG